jgi:hypothetical protein
MLNLRPRFLPVMAALLAAPGLWAAPAVATHIEFAPEVEAQLKRFGSEEGATLRAAIESSVQHATARLDMPKGALVEITLEEVAPTHPTRKQLNENPAQDETRTKYLGGAALVGYVRDANRQVLARISYRHFAPTLALGSASLDPWADARLAIEAFADKLAAACSKTRAQS